jgi:hypothetical protein
LPKLSFDIRKTDNWEESPAPGEWLVFTHADKPYEPPEEPKEMEKEKEKKEESRSLTEMYGAEPELIKEVIDYWRLGWPQIQFIANHGAQTNLKQFQVQHANAPHRREMRGTPLQLSKLALFKFFRKYEKQIWEGAEYAGQDIEGSDTTALKFIGSLNGAKDIHSLNDIGVLAAKWAIEESCQRILDDYEENHETPDEGEYREIWEPTPEHEELHTDVGGYDESIMRRLRRGA